MNAPQFIQANFWPLLAVCGVVFVLGFVLWLIGTAMAHGGEQQPQTVLSHESAPARVSPPDCPYPPIPDAEYNPIECYR